VLVLLLRYPCIVPYQYIVLFFPHPCVGSYSEDADSYILQK
jgi:hypothetical protein